MTPDVSFNNIIHNISKLCSRNEISILLHNIWFKGPAKSGKEKLSVTTKEHYYIPENNN